MKQQTPTYIRELLECARLAPSVHNTQPWHFTVDGSTISLTVAKNRQLQFGDPTQRELWISLGICFETLLQAAEGLGLIPIINFTQTDSIEDPIANLKFTPGANRQQSKLDLLKRRHSYRGPMDKVVIPSSLLEMCDQAISDLPGTSVSLLNKKADLTKVANLTNKGMSLALSNPDFRSELADLINYNWSKSHVGMHGFALNRGFVGAVWEKWSIKFGLDTKRKARADQQKVLEASGLIFIQTKGDVPSFWFNAGRAYMRVALEVTRANLDQSTIAAVVEAADFHEDVERTLHTTDRIQTMIRIGKASRENKHVAPTRLSVEELLT